MKRYYSWAEISSAVLLTLGLIVLASENLSKPEAVLNYQVFGNPALFLMLHILPKSKHLPNIMSINNTQELLLF